MRAASDGNPAPSTSAPFRGCVEYDPSSRARSPDATDRPITSPDAKSHVCCGRAGGGFCGSTIHEERGLRRRCRRRRRPMPATARSPMGAAKGFVLPRSRPLVLRTVRARACESSRGVVLYFMTSRCDLFHVTVAPTQLRAARWVDGSPAWRRMDLAAAMSTAPSSDAKRTARRGNDDILTHLGRGGESVACNATRRWRDDGMLGASWNSLSRWFSWRSYPLGGTRRESSISSRARCGAERRERRAPVGPALGSVRWFRPRPGRIGLRPASRVQGITAADGAGAARGHRPLPKILELK